MNVVILPNNKIDDVIAKVFIDTIISKPNCVLGLATGSSPLGVYKSLISANKEKKVNFRNVKTFNLDEYVGIDETHPQSYRFFMNDVLFNHINIDIKNTFVPSGMGDVEKTALNYDNDVSKAGGIDLQILGIGSNGHIAFNEPGTSFDSLTHVVELQKSTRLDNARFFNSLDEVPTHAITTGLASIMKARKIILIATGAKKAEAIAKLVNGEMTTELPASILKDHPDVTIYVDEEAASLIK